jgi:hypothetical protein
MTTEIDGQALSGIEVTLDGSSLRLHVIDTAGRKATLKLPADCISSLIMSLPNADARALCLRHKDESLRTVFPVHSTIVERSTDPDIYIVTIGTPDAFQVSFGLSPSQCRSIWERVKTAEASGESIRHFS